MVQDDALVYATAGGREAPLPRLSSIESMGGWSGAASRAADGPDASGPSIMPTPPTCPNVAPLTETIMTGGNGYTIAAGTSLYSNAINCILSGYNDLITNNGTVWLHSPTVHGWFATGGLSSIINSGDIYIRGERQVQLAAQTVSLTNTGSIYIVADMGRSRGVTIEGYAASVDNSGLIAVQTLGVSGDGFTNHAIAIEVMGTPGIINRAGGRILAEAPDLAIAISYGGSGNENTPVLDNAGLIAANATAAGGISIGVDIAQYGTHPTIVVNSGTIRGDYAIYAQAASETVVNPIEVIDNRATGVLDGDVSLGIGDDRIQNDGRIIGNVDMGAGNDRFLGSGTISGIVDMGFGADIYSGTAGNDRARGGRDSDVLSGHDGQD
ncbi:MAG: hypothetical protein EOP59_06485, partial [Sphingomonadales bacterium]